MQLSLFGKILGRQVLLAGLVTKCLSGAAEPCGTALAMHQAGHFEEAILSYWECTAVEPGNVQALSNLGAALAHEGRFAEAAEQDRRALALAPPEMRAALRGNLALAYYKSARIPEAIREFEQVLKEKPADRRATLLLAECELTSGRPERAVQLLEPLDKEDDAPVTYLLGSALLRAGRLERGQRVLDRILKQGESAEGHLLLGVSMFRAQNYPEAVKELERARQLKPELASVNSYYGQALLNTGDATGAAEAFARELQANPSDFEANLRLGQILTARKRDAEAAPYLERATRIRPDYREVLTPAEDDGPAVGAVAPAVAELEALRKSGPVLAVFGSYTCPQLRGASAAMNELYEEFGARVPFVLVYVSEAHGAGSAWQSTINERDKVDLPAEQNLEDKRQHAALCVRKLAITYRVVVDGMGKEAEKAYAAWPSRVYLIGADGKIRFKSRLTELDFDRARLRDALAKVTAE